MGLTIKSATLLLLRWMELALRRLLLFDGDKIASASEFRNEAFRLGLLGEPTIMIISESVLRAMADFFLGTCSGVMKSAANGRHSESKLPLLMIPEDDNGAELGDIVVVVCLGLSLKLRFMRPAGDTNPLLDKDLFRLGTGCSPGVCIDADKDALKAMKGDSVISTGIESADRLLVCFVLEFLRALRCS